MGHGRQREGHSGLCRGQVDVHEVESSHAQDEELGITGREGTIHNGQAGTVNSKQAAICTLVSQALAPERDRAHAAVIAV